MARKRKTIPYENWNRDWPDAHGLKWYFKRRAINFERGVTEEQVDEFFSKLANVLLQTDENPECHQFMVWFEPLEGRPAKKGLIPEEAWATRSHVSQVVYEATRKPIGEFRNKLRELNKTLDDLNKKLKKIPGVQSMRLLGSHWFEGPGSPHDTLMTLITWDKEYQRVFDEEKASFNTGGIIGKRSRGKSGRPPSWNNSIIFQTMTILLNSKSKTKVKTTKQATEIVADALTYFADRPLKRPGEKKVNHLNVKRAYHREKRKRRSRR